MEEERREIKLDANLIPRRKDVKAVKGRACGALLRKLQTGCDDSHGDTDSGDRGKIIILNLISQPKLR